MAFRGGYSFKQAVKENVEDTAVPSGYVSV